MSLLGEIRRRKVFQVAGTYAVVAWLVVQIGSTVATPLGLPAGFVTAVILLAAAGFPVAVVLAWAFELTPAGVARTDSLSATGARTATGSPLQLVLTALIATGIGAGGAWLWLKPPDRTWILEQAVPEIEAHIDNGDFESAHRTLAAALERAPDDPALTELLPRIDWTTSITSEPEGATVYRRGYDSDPESWELLGETPLAATRIPYGLSRLRLEHDGYARLDGTIGGGVLVNTTLELPDPGQLFAVGAGHYRLDTEAALDDGAKVRVPGWSTTLLNEPTTFNDFFLGRYEVTNAEFKAFVDDGGYRQPALWRELAADGIAFEDAMARFVDSTGNPGPATWAGGSYPEGRAKFPVGGVSFYEAGAYARYRGEALPTVHHWRQAIAPAAFTWTLPLGNLDSESLREVGAGDAMSWVGAYDLVGNVREWTVNAIGERRATMGASAADALFVATQNWVPLDPMDRSEYNGFRTMRGSDEPAVMARANAEVAGLAPGSPFEPASDDRYAGWSVLFDYPEGPLEAVVESTETTLNWRRQRITFNAAYGGERMVLYLYLPESANPPYQTVVYWPGSSAVFLSSIDDYTVNFDYVIKSGRAVAFPVYQGTFERGGGRTTFVMDASVAYRDTVIDTVKDLRRSIDYLETRSDIDTEALAFYGHSWGTVNGASGVAQEPRFKTAIMYVAFPGGLAPEVHPRNALPRVQIPVLVLSGEFDPVVPRWLADLYYEAIGTREPDKRHLFGPGGHFVAREFLIPEVLSWLDERLGMPLRYD